MVIDSSALIAILLGEPVTQESLFFLKVMILQKQIFPRLTGYRRDGSLTILNYSDYLSRIRA